MKASIEKYSFVVIRLSSLLLPLLTLWGISLGGVYTYLGFLQIFAFYSLFEVLFLVLGIELNSNDKDQFKFVGPGKRDQIEHFSLYLYLLLYFICFPLTLKLIASHQYQITELIGAALSLAVVSGSTGGLIAHELIHRPSKLERFIGMLAFNFIYYGHFAVTHIRGHHVHVGKYRDWGTARRGESIYHFLLRAVFAAYLGGWKIEHQRLKGKGLSTYVLKNDMIKSLLLTSVYTLAIVYFGGAKLLAFVLLTSSIGIVFIECVNYISHYGLIRKKLPQGRHENISEFHSWDSKNKVTNWFIFNGGRHAHHHLSPTTKHHELGLSFRQPPLPLGLPGMVALCLIPPLYFKFMNLNFKEVTR